MFFHRSCLFFLFAAVFLLSFVGCSSITSSNIRTINSMDLAVHAPPTSIRGVATVELEARDLRGKALILVDTPDKLRIDILGALKRPVFILASSGEDCDYLSNGQVVSCDIGSDDFALPFELSELIGILLGSVEDILNSEKDQDAEWRLLTDIKERPWRLYKYLPGDSDTPALTVSMEDYREVFSSDGDGTVIGYLPFSVTIEDDKERLSIQYKSVELNVEIDSALFNISGS